MMTRTLSSQVASVIQTSGRPLPAQTRAEMEHGFGESTIRQPGDHAFRRPLEVCDRDDNERAAEQAAADATRAASTQSAPEPFRFDQVKIHSDAAAAASAKALNARAYAVGNHIVFGAGQFSPAKADGRRLLAHELAHVAQVDGLGPPERLPIMRQVDDEIEEARRRAIASMDWLAATPPIVMDDNAPYLIAWARKQALEFEDPATRDERRPYLAQGLLRVRQRLQELEKRAKHDSDGALLYTDILRDTAVPWTEARPQTLAEVDLFTPQNIALWQTASRPAPETRRPGRQKPVATPSDKAKPPPGATAPSKTATNITFSKQSGMTLKTEEGQRLIMYFVLASTRTGYTADQLDWVVSHLGLEKRWAPPTKMDLAAWQDSFEEIPVGGQVTLTITNSFTTEVNNLLLDVPSRRAFQLEGVRRGVVDAKAGLYLGIGTFAVGSLAFGGGALLGTSLSAGGALGGGSLLSGGGLLGGGIGQSAGAVGSYLSINAPQILGGTLLYGGAILSGAALGEHVLQIRSQGWQGWRRELPQFAEDVSPLVSGYAESQSLRVGGGGGGHEPDENPPAGGGGPGGGSSGSTGGGGRQTLRASPPPMPENPAAPRPPASTLRGSPPPAPTRTAGGPEPATDVDLVKANVNAPSSIKPQDPASHQADWQARGGSRTAPPAYRDGEGNVRVSTDHPLLGSPKQGGIPPPAGAARQGPHVFTQKRFGGAVPPASVAPGTPAGRKLGLADTGEVPAPSKPNVGLEDTGQAPASNKPDIGLEDTGKGPAQPAPAKSVGGTGGRSTGPKGPVEMAQPVSLDRAEKLAKLNPGQVLRSVSSETHRRGWMFNGGDPDNTPAAYIVGKTIFVDPDRWPADRPWPLP